jgi:hypothetical protein
MRGATSGSHDAHAVRPRYDDINVPLIILVGVIAALFTYLTIVFVEGMTYHWGNAVLREQSYDVSNIPVKRILDAQKAELQGDPALGLPSIDEAMKMVVDRYADRASHSSPAENAETTPSSSSQ